jgi:hypothetical protein
LTLFHLTAILADGDEAARSVRAFLDAWSRAGAVEF